MELKNNSYTENIADIDGEMIGRKLLLPNCVNCIYLDGAKCVKYNAMRINLDKQGIDIFHCQGFRAKKDNPLTEKVKSMGFSGE